MENSNTPWSDDEGTSSRQEIEHLRMLSRAVDQSPALVVITDNQGNIQYVNPKFIQITGYAFEEIVGRNPRLLKSGETPPEEYKKLWDVITSGNEWRGEFHNKKKNGELYWEFASISPIRNSQGQITHFLAVKEDITKRKRLEKEILEISEREQQRLGHDLHDDLGQHLTGIAFLAKVLAQKLASGSLPEAEEATEIASLINQAIAKTRALAKGLCPVELEGDDLVSGLQQLAANVQNVFGVSCTTECNTPFPTPLNGAAIHLFRIAQEAVTNAVRHGNATTVLIEIANLKNESVLTVRDNGIGIPEVLDTNSGLGLHIMKYRTRVINGSLSIERDGDTGTIVRCTIHNKVKDKATQ